MTPDIVTTHDLFIALQALLRKAGKPDTPYGISKFLGASRQSAYNWRDSLKVMDDEYGLKAAQALGWDVDHVLACLAAERAERAGSAETAAVWRHVALRLATAASVVFLGIYSVFFTSNPVL